MGSGEMIRRSARFIGISDKELHLSGEEVLKVGQYVHPYWGGSVDGDRCFMYCVASALDVLEDLGLTIK